MRNLQSAPRSHLPCFQNLHTFTFRLWRSRTISGTTSNLGLSTLVMWFWGFMFVRTIVVFGTAILVPCHTVSQYPLGMKPVLPSTAGAEGRPPPERPLATRSRFASSRSRFKWPLTAETRTSYFRLSLPSSAR